MQYVLPLATVELSHINETWNGVAHFVAPIEPYDGVIGEETAKYHSRLCRENWVGYRVDDAGRYTLDCDDYYFLKQPRKDRKLSRDERQYDELVAHYKAAINSYQKLKTRFATHGVLYPDYVEEEQDGKFTDDDLSALVNDLGGTPGWPNWAEMQNFPLRKQQDLSPDDGQLWTSAYPETTDQGKFDFIGWIPVYNYIGPCHFNLYLFYNNDARLALTTFDWS